MSDRSHELDLTDDAASDAAPSATRAPRAVDGQRGVDDLLAFFGPGGRIEAAMPGYEYRVEQLAMAHCVADALETGRHAVVEAGTGVGKSFAYLVPALLHAHRDGSIVVVSTNTIALQEQLARHDVPFLQSVMPFAFTAALAKGRGNYVSLRRLRKAMQSGPAMFDGDGDQIEELVAWAETTTDGTRADVPFTLAPGVWETVQSDRTNCLGPRCKTYRECVYFRARREYAKANLLIVNHHLLLTDLAVRRRIGPHAGILPRYRALIVDEAHDLESVATHCLGLRITQAQVDGYLRRLYRADRGRGVLTKFSGGIALDAITAVSRVRDAARAFFDDVQAIALERQRDGDSFGVGGGRPQPVRITEPLGIDNALSHELSRLAESLSAVRESVGTAEDEAELGSQVVRALEHAQTIEQFLAGDIDDAVYWIEPRGDATWDGGRGSSSAARSVALHMAPIDVGPLLARDLFAAGATVICTSATLATAASGAGAFHAGREFEHFRQRVGLDRPVALTRANTAADHDDDETEQGDASLDEIDRGVEAWRDDDIDGRATTNAAYDGDDAPWFDGEPTPMSPASRQRLLMPLEVNVASPFDYAANVRVVIPRDMPEPRDPDFEATLAAWVAHLLVEQGGRTFVLFTNTQLMRRTHERVVERLADECSFALMMQGEGKSRTRLLDEFTDDETSVLFGVTSFWQGVDVPGDSLSQVIITRLPFAVPTEPVIAARQEAIEAGGGSSFFAYSLPEAVLRLKQGFGRLIRSKTDRGTVAILDSRVTTKRYGQNFLAALPQCPIDRPVLGR